MLSLLIDGHRTESYLRQYFTYCLKL